MSQIHEHAELSETMLDRALDAQIREHPELSETMLDTELDHIITIARAVDPNPPIYLSNSPSARSGLNSRRWGWARLPQR